MLHVQIQKKFAGFQLDVGFTVSSGVTALFGPSGSGKSVTLKSISGLLAPDQGEISLHDTVLFSSREGINVPPQKRRIGYLFQNYALFPHLNVAENIVYGIRHLPKEEQQEKRTKLIQMMQLHGQEKKKPGEISGGQQQRVALARTLATDPQLILLDEPFSALDSAVKSSLRAELLDILEAKNIPAIIVTHDLNEAYSMSDHITIIEMGRIMQSDNKWNIINAPANIAVAELTRAKNIFSGTIAKQEEMEKTGVNTSWGTFFLTPSSPFTPGKTIHFFIRPHHIQVFDPEEKHLPEENILEGTVTNIISHIDSHTLYLKKTSGPADDVVFVKVNDDLFDKLNLAKNSRVCCYFPPDCIGVIG
ncbi:sulfate/molybdate ABC transporter ATP-binding protein [Candidatus Formimonas warabiya]|uniref:ABC transporter domain-containing protein n=1 Tax=Formimonas warabiya TaxID=1761012 RepID=A0A3G1KR50_FORW1|nr:ABC transporter ATP-binding protein [Candidatus Formimonas warabiya]ATW24920.1 hypothetical protein DCMF_09175 [Candidatus Formimonas warabiya]